jgi:hypothetical protein
MSKLTSDPSAKTNPTNNNRSGLTMVLNMLRIQPKSTVARSLLLFWTLNLARSKPNGQLHQAAYKIPTDIVKGSQHKVVFVISLS